MEDSCSKTRDSAPKHPASWVLVCSLEAQSRSEKIALNSVLWGSSTVAMGSLAHRDPPWATPGMPAMGSQQQDASFKLVWPWKPFGIGLLLWSKTFETTLGMFSGWEKSIF